MRRVIRRYSVTASSYSSTYRLLTTPLRIFRVFSIVRTYLFYFSIMRYEGWDGEMVPQPGMARGGW